MVSVKCSLLTLRPHRRPFPSATRSEPEIQYLKKPLDDNGISYDYEAHLRTLQSDVGDIVFPELGPEHASLLYSYFKGRRDVYALRARDGQGYYTQCDNFWGTGICPKKSGLKVGFVGKCKTFPKSPFRGAFTGCGCGRRAVLPPRGALPLLNSI